MEKIKSENQPSSIKSTTRLFVILATESSTAVILRRGPSKQVQLIKWDRNKDVFEYGQWFKGRIYERVCDLSPRGDKFIYWAATWKKPIESWTAVSKPPYLTALTLWENGCYGGGGLFLYENRIRLNHPYITCAKGFSLPDNIQVEPFTDKVNYEGYNPFHCCLN